MSCIDVEALIKWECNWVVVQCGISGGVMRLDRHVGQTRNELLNPPNALGTGDGITKCGAIPSQS